MIVKARELELHVRNYFSSQDNFRIATDALRNNEAVEHRCVVTTGGDAH